MKMKTKPNIKAKVAILIPDKIDFETKAIQHETKKDPATPFLGIYPKKHKTLNQKDICIHMFTAALFTITKVWKQPECPSVGEWIKKWCIYTMKYDSATKE